MISVHHVFIVAGMLSGLYLVTHAFWLKKQGNISGFYLAIGISITAIALPVWRIFSK